MGETMVLFEANDRGLIQYDQNFYKSIGGAESNVAIGLSKLGHNSMWISKLGNDPFGKYIYNFIKGEGVDVSAVKFTDEKPTGVFFKENGKFNSTNIYYYRNQSAASLLNVDDIDEEAVKKVKYIHLTGITPALSQTCYEVVKHVMKLGKKHQIPVVFDPNIRYSLWNESEYIEVYKELLQYVDYFLPGESELKSIFPDFSEEESTNLLLAGGVKAIVIKKGINGATVYTDEGKQHIDGFPNEHVVDPVGAGDAFASGFLSGLLDGLSLNKSVERANLVGSMVTMVKGDCEGLPTKEEITGFLNEFDDVKR